LTNTKPQVSGLLGLLIVSTDLKLRGSISHWIGAATTKKHCILSPLSRGHDYLCSL